jgi:DNA-binding CsgD family transcriptional regulator
MPPADGNGIAELTPGEIDCIRLLIEGMSDREIGCALNIAPSTAHWRIEQAKRKLKLRTRAQLTAIAVHRGYVSL